MDNHPRWLGTHRQRSGTSLWTALLAVLYCTTVGASVGPLPSTDGELKAAVDRVLRRIPHIREGQIQLEANHGTIRLQGEVSNLAVRRRVFRRVASIRGVLAIDDQLRLKQEHRSDRTVGFDLWSRLSMYADLHAPQVRWSVQEGHVQMEGSVSTVGRLLFLEDQVRGVRGVMGLDLSGVRVRSFDRHTLSGERLRRAITHLLRDPALFPIAGRFEVQLQNEQIVLEGTVPRLIDRLEALQVARLASRDQVIVDHLRLDPSLGRLVIRSTGAVP